MSANIENEKGRKPEVNDQQYENHQQLRIATARLRSSGEIKNLICPSGEELGAIGRLEPEKAVEEARKVVEKYGKEAVYIALDYLSDDLREAHMALAAALGISAKGYAESFFHRPDPDEKEGYWQSELGKKWVAYAQSLLSE